MYKLIYTIIPIDTEELTRDQQVTHLHVSVLNMQLLLHKSILCGEMNFFPYVLISCWGSLVTHTAEHSSQSVCNNALSTSVCVRCGESQDDRCKADSEKYCTRMPHISLA